MHNGANKKQANKKQANKAMLVVAALHLPRQLVSPFARQL